MASRLNPYLNFRGSARQALEFYASVFGGELRIDTHGQYGDPGSPIADQVMHGQLETPMGVMLMCSDVPPEMALDVGRNIAICLSGDDGEALRGYWERLSEGAEVTAPLEQQMWGAEFGACTDRFGVPWMVNIGSAG